MRVNYVFVGLGITEVYAVMQSKLDGSYFYFAKWVQNMLLKCKLLNKDWTVYGSQ
jgi:hypothetical protein